MDLISFDGAPIAKRPASSVACKRHASTRSADHRRREIQRSRRLPLNWPDQAAALSREFFRGGVTVAWGTRETVSAARIRCMPERLYCRGAVPRSYQGALRSRARAAFLASPQPPSGKLRPFPGDHRLATPATERAISWQCLYGGPSGGGSFAKEPERPPARGVMSGSNSDNPGDDPGGATSCNSRTSLPLIRRYRRPGQRSKVTATDPPRHASARQRSYPAGRTASPGRRRMHQDEGPGDASPALVGRGSIIR